MVAMGSVCDTIEETVDYLNAHGEKVGLVKVHLYRPFSVKHLVEVLPASVKKISVLDRTKEPGSLGEPLYLDVVAALHDTPFANIPVYGGRYGLGSKDTNPGHIISVFRNMEAAEPKKRFTIAIEDDVTHLSLPVSENPDTTPKARTPANSGVLAQTVLSAQTRTPLRSSAIIPICMHRAILPMTPKIRRRNDSHLRFGEKPIKSTYLINQADFVACHNPSYVTKYKMVEDLKKGGIFLLNCSWDAAQLDEHLPGSMKRYIAQNDIQFYTIDATHIAKELGLGGRVNTILQAAFFKLSGIIPEEKAVQLMKDAATRSYGKKGEKIVAMNHAAIERGVAGTVKVEIPATWQMLRIRLWRQRSTPTAPSLKSSSRRFLSPRAPSLAINCPYPPSRIRRTVPSRRAPLRLKSAASQLIRPAGFRKIVSSVTSAPMFARMRHSPVRTDRGRGQERP